MSTMDTIQQAHAQEMKELRQSLTASRRLLRQDRSRMAHELSELKKRAAAPLCPAPKTTPLHVRIFSLLF